MPGLICRTVEISYSLGPSTGKHKALRCNYLAAFREHGPKAVIGSATVAYPEAAAEKSNHTNTTINFETIPQASYLLLEGGRRATVQQI